MVGGLTGITMGTIYGGMAETTIKSRRANSQKMGSQHGHYKEIHHYSHSRPYTVNSQKKVARSGDSSSRGDGPTWFFLSVSKFAGNDYTGVREYLTPGRPELFAEMIKHIHTGIRMLRYCEAVWGSWQLE